MKLSKNFTLSEITHSNTAKRLGIKNEPTETHLQNIQHLSHSSQHCKGEALDLQFWKAGEINNKVIYDWILQSGLKFDQMINEFDFAWIHVSLKAKDNRRQVLEAYKNKEGDTAYKIADISRSI